MRSGDKAGAACQPAAMQKAPATKFHGLLAVVLLAAGCAGAPVREPPPAVTPPVTPAPPGDAASDPGGAIAQSALAMIGVPYRYGGADPTAGFDCSGLVYYTYTLHGHAVPRTSREQFGVAQKITLAQAGRGDLVFFQDQEKLSHVGIYLGDGRFIHAPSSGGTVRVADIQSPYYQRHLVAVGRLLP
jgi:cell wall-associated NlpC family hydrolase